MRRRRLSPKRIRSTGPRRVQRYATVTALKAATLEECRRRANAEAKPYENWRWPERERWQESDWAYLRMSNRPRPFEAAASIDAEARGLCSEWQGLLQRIRTFLKGCDAAARTELAPVLQLVAESSEAPELRLKFARPVPMPSIVARVSLVMNWDKRGHWWWPDTRPSRTDLAVLSILAGNFPDVRKTMRDATIDPTPAAAIEREARNIDHALEALGMQLPAKKRRRRSYRAR